MALTAGNDDKPESLQDYARRHIKSAIADGTIPPGTRLSPNLLAPQLGLSHIPIREALAGLAASGYVDYARGKGYIARALSSQDLTDLYHWRGVLEREAYQIAVPKLTDADIAEMARLAGLMEESAQTGDRAEYVQLNRDFHFVAFERTKSERLLRFLNFLWDQQAPYASLALPASARSHAENVALIPLFASRNVEGVIAAMDEHRATRLKQVAAWETDHGSGAAKRDSGPRKSSKASRAKTPDADTASEGGVRTRRQSSRS
ncbi:GntR family transcriptional regulator [Rhodococcus opacus]|uniref:GntR family transcriptional regulator n=1 Tax=Rhodococcus opacus TaxID=37919 RepID=UPI002475C228|nr:GntR family transcriptional regulator [Rhodococcus opacus]MDH6293310.1 DNA-binding GntR family transcriptional regulator [Rhodococcus opacus]